MTQGDNLKLACALVFRFSLSQRKMYEFSFVVSSMFGVSWILVLILYASKKCRLSKFIFQSLYKLVPHIFQENYSKEFLLQNANIIYIISSSMERDFVKVWVALS